MVQVHVPLGVGVRVPPWAPLPDSQKSRKLSRVCGFFHFRPQRPTQPGGALKKQAVFSISHRETGFFRRKQPFLRKTAKCSLTESPPALMILSVAAEHAANSRKQQQCPRGGIGRRAWFRSMCLRVWGFESLRGHQQRAVFVVIRSKSNTAVNQQ